MNVWMEGVERGKSYIFNPYPAGFSCSSPSPITGATYLHGELS